MVDLFAGCGGLGLGMEMAGFLPYFVNELNDDAMATYLANREHELGGKPFSRQANLRCKDAHELQGERLEALVDDLRALGIDLPTREEAMRGEGLSTLDLVAGGPPCQGYSGIGHRRSYAVDREKVPSNQLYDRMASIIERLRPRVFLFENVRGLLSARWTPGGDLIWEHVKKRFKAIKGYEVRWSLVRAADYGVPQNRPRVLLVGYREDVADGNPLLDLTDDTADAREHGFLPEGRGGAPDLCDLLGDLVDPSVLRNFEDADYPRGEFATKSYPRKPRGPVQGWFRGPRHPGGKPAPLSDHEYSKHRARVVEKFKFMLDNGGRIPGHLKTKKFAQKRLLPRWENGPSITATSLPDDYVHFAQPRILTVREWARLQTFPDWYQFHGPRTTGGLRRAGNPRAAQFEREVPKYTQIGNAVPVWLARAVGLHLDAVLAASEKVRGSSGVAPASKELAA